jgi:flagellar assembly protein FliH
MTRSSSEPGPPRGTTAAAQVDPTRLAVPLRGDAAGTATPARIDRELRTSPLAQRFGSDPRLADPRLESAFAATAERVRRAAQVQGYAEGHAAGLREARQAAAAVAAAEEARHQAAARAAGDRVTQALVALATAASMLESRVVPTAREVEDVARTAALALTEALLGRELAVAREPGLDAVRRALALAPRDRPVLVRLHPDDHATLSPHAVQQLPQAAGRSVQLVADPSVEPGGAVADCDATRIDAQLGPALDRVREVLAP